MIFKHTAAQRSRVEKGASSIFTPLHNDNKINNINTSPKIYVININLLTNLAPICQSYARVNDE